MMVNYRKRRIELKGQYVYKLDCGEIFTGPKGLPEGAPGQCDLHGMSRTAGFGISKFSFLYPDYDIPEPREG